MEMWRYVGAGVLVAVAGCGGRGVTTKAEAPPVPRSAFRASVTGKTAEEVQALYGPPKRTSDFGEGRIAWNYHRLTKDDVAGLRDGWATVWFRDGRAEEVEFTGD
jgi:hypothetical protein